MSSGVGRSFEGGGGPQLPDVAPTPLPILPKPFHIDLGLALPLPRLLGREGSLVYPLSPPAMSDVAKSWTDAQLGAHVPSRNPREKPFEGLPRPLEFALDLAKRDAIGLTPLLAEGLCPGVGSADAAAEPCMPLRPRRLRGLMPASLSTPAGMRPVEGIGAGRKESAMVWLEIV